MIGERVAGRVCLDFAATMAERGTTDLEHLAAPGDLAQWLVGGGVLTEPAGVDQRDLLAARELREALYRATTASIDGHAVAEQDREVINAAATTAPPVPTLDSDGRLRRAGGAGAGLSALARDCLDLLAGPERVLLRRCAGAACTRVFIDRSRGASRRWCEMAGCGDRAKAATYRARRTTR